MDVEPTWISTWHAKDNVSWLPDFALILPQRGVETGRPWHTKLGDHCT